MLSSFCSSHSLFFVFIPFACRLAFLFRPLISPRKKNASLDFFLLSDSVSSFSTHVQHEAVDRRERLRRLALETIDLAKDPYFMRNHLGR